MSAPPANWMTKREHNPADRVSACDASVEVKRIRRGGVRSLNGQPWLQKGRPRVIITGDRSYTSTEDRLQARISPVLCSSPRMGEMSEELGFRNGRELVQHGRSIAAGR